MIGTRFWCVMDNQICHKPLNETLQGPGFPASGYPNPGGIVSGRPQVVTPPIAPRLVVLMKYIPAWLSVLRRKRSTDHSIGLHQEG